MLIWLLALLLLRLLHKAVRLLRAQIEARADRSREPRRIETLTSVFRHTANILLLGLAGILTLGELGVSVAPLLATAGVAGIAIGFGAQSLVKDFFTGLCLLVENQVSEGDLVDVAGKVGVVERVTLRHIRLRDDDGSLHFIPNSLITVVTNRSRQHAWAIIDLAVPREADLHHVARLMQLAFDDIRADPVFAENLLGGLEFDGIEKLETANVTLRCRLKVLPPHQTEVRRRFLGRMKILLDTPQTSDGGVRG